MPVTINGSNTPTAGGVVYGDGTNYASTAAGSAGGVLYSAGSGAPAFNAVGTAGQVLTSAGASAPTWTTPSAGALTYISTTTISSAATTFAITSGFSSTYDEYVMNFYNVTFSGGSALELRFYLGGTLYTASDYIFCTVGAGGSTAGADGGNAQSRIKIMRTSCDSFISGTINFYNINSTTNNQSVISNVSGTSTSATTAYTNIATCGGRVSAGSAAITGVQFINSNTANFLTGTFKLYGVQKA